MGKTRRKLYGKKRRQRGGGSRWWVLLGALAALQGAHAEDPGFRGRIAKWWNSKTIRESAENSIDAANYMTSMKWVPTTDLWTSEASVSEDVYAPPSEEQKQMVDDVVEPYIESGLVENKEYKVIALNPGELYALTNNDIYHERKVQFLGEGKSEIERGDEDVLVDGYYVRRTGEEYQGEKFFVPKDVISLEPVKGGRRKQRRKTLRRKK
jgi:hypothetical protein